MADVGTPSTPAADGKIARRIGLALAGLVLAGCCFWSGLGAWLFAPLTPFLANRLSYSQGKAEVIAPAQWRPGGGQMSPDGRYMVLGWTRDGPHELFVWDLVTGERHPFRVGLSSLCWLNSNQLAVFDSASNTYYLIQSHDASLVQATFFSEKQYKEKGGFEQIKQQLQTAEQIYVMEHFDISGYTIITVAHAQSFVYHFPGSVEQNLAAVEALVQDLPHVRIPDRCSFPPEGRDVYSPDGRYYYRLSMGDNAHVLMYTREGQLVAEAAKSGWTPRMLGWAHDSSGVYFQMLIKGGAASMLVPYEPIFKLSPLTPEEQRSRLIWRIATWAGGIGVVGGAGWWLWRRRRRVAR